MPTQPALTPFTFEGAAVRVVTREGEPWFVLADVCKVLDVGNVSDAGKRLDDDEKDGVDTIDAIGRPQKATVINESGLYSLVLTSRKPEAKRFKKWITSEVLPAIRKTGGYQVGQPETREQGEVSCRIEIQIWHRGFRSKAGPPMTWWR